MLPTHVSRLAAMGTHMRALRQVRGLTLDALAEPTGLDKGYLSRLEPGQLADLAMLSADPWTLPLTGLKDIAALMNPVGAQVVHEARLACGQG